MQSVNNSPTEWKVRDFVYYVVPHYRLVRVVTTVVWRVQYSGFRRLHETIDHGEGVWQPSWRLPAMLIGMNGALITIDDKF